MDPVAMDPESARLAKAEPESTKVEPVVEPEITACPPQPLLPREVEMLAFERQWWKFAGAKEQAIRELFDMSATRYYQVLNTLIDRPEALAHDPMLVKRLRRTREARRRSGSARSLGAHG